MLRFWLSYLRLESLARGHQLNSRSPPLAKAKLRVVIRGTYFMGPYIAMPANAGMKKPIVLFIVVCMCVLVQFLFFFREHLFA